MNTRMGSSFLFYFTTAFTY